MPVVTAITPRMKAYMVIVVGAFVSAASVLSPITLLLARRWLDVERRRRQEAAGS